MNYDKNLIHLNANYVKKKYVNINKNELYIK